MLKDLTQVAQQCPQDIQEHNQRTGKLIRALLIGAGRGELVDLWQIESYCPCDYHDIGKTVKETMPLDHCEAGAYYFSQAYQDASSPGECIFYSIASDLCRYHHERWDGSGGPRHLAGDDITIVARAGAVANAWDHLVQDHPGVAPLILFEHIEKHSGTWYDPQMVFVLKQLIPSLIPGMPEE